MKISRSVLHKMREIRLDEYIESEALARLLDKWNAKLPDDLTASAITPKEEAGLDLVGVLADIVANFTDDHVR